MIAIDHVTIAGASLAAMREALAAAGIPTEYGGTHRDGATEMALASFPDGSYLELIAPQAAASAETPTSHPWARFFAGGGEPCAWAVRPRDLAAEVGRLRHAGIETSEAVANGRLRPDGVQLAWQTAVCGPGPAGSFFPFLIEDFMARELRVFPSGAPGNDTFGGIARVVLGVPDLAAALVLYRQAYGISVAARQSDDAFAAEIAVLDGAPAVLAQPLHPDSWLARRLDRFGTAPCAVLLAGTPAGASPGSTEGQWGDLRIAWCGSAPGWQLGCCEELAVNP